MGTLIDWQLLKQLGILRSSRLPYLDSIGDATSSQCWQGRMRLDDIGDLSVSITDENWSGVFRSDCVGSVKEKVPAIAASRNVLTISANKRDILDCLYIGVVGI